MLKTVTFTLMHFCIAFSVTYALTGSIAMADWSPRSSRCAIR